MLLNYCAHTSFDLLALFFIFLSFFLALRLKQLKQDRKQGRERGHCAAGGRGRHRTQAAAAVNMESCLTHGSPFHCQLFHCIGEVTSGL